jgi:hypothetical protein
MVNDALRERGRDESLREGEGYCPERIFEGFEHSSLQIEVPQIIVHKTHQPNVIVNFFDGDGLAGEDLAEVDLFVA